MKIYSNGEMLQVGGGAQEVYDGEERVIGTWFGKPLYRKVYLPTFPSEVSPSWSTVPNSVVDNLKVVVSLQGVFMYPGDETTPDTFIALSRYDNASYPVEISYRRNIGLLFRFNREALFGKSFIVIMEYTKTTDEATVELPAALTVSMPNFAATHQSAASVVLDPGIKDGEV